MPIIWSWKRECSEPGKEVFRATWNGRFSTWNLTVRFDPDVKSIPSKPWIARIGLKTPQLPQGTQACAIAWEDRYFEAESAKLEVQAMVAKLVQELGSAAEHSEIPKESSVSLPLTG